MESSQINKMFMKTGTPHCPRCGGLLHSVMLRDFGKSAESLHCIMCGTYFDPTIIDHKIHGPRKETR
jgi:transcription elongation factor Elf1